MDTNKNSDATQLAQPTRADRQQAARDALVDEQYAEFHFGRDAEPIEDLVRRVLVAAVEEAWALGARSGAARKE